MQIFLAIDIPDQMKKKLNRQLSELQQDYPQLSWVPEWNYHLTVYFFGEVDNLEKLKQRTTDILYNAPSFHLFSLGADLFIHKKIMLYIEFQRQKKLEELVTKVKSIAESGGDRETQDLQYVPHVTIARYKIPSKQQYFLLKKKLERLEIDIDFPVNKVSLYQSILHARAPEYKKIAEFPLISD